MIEETEEYSFKIGTQEIKLSSEELSDPNCMSDLLSDIIGREKEWAKLGKITQLEAIDGLIKKLIDLKVNLDAHNQGGRTPLYVAIQEGDIKVVELLIKYGANVNNKDERNRTPLHIAIGRKQLGSVNKISEKPYERTNEV